MRSCATRLQKKIASPGHGILAMDESNATCGKRLDSIGLENTEANRQAYRELLVTTPGLGEYISGAILFEETLYQKTSRGTSMVDELNKQSIVPGECLPVRGAVSFLLCCSSSREQVPARMLRPISHQQGGGQPVLDPCHSPASGCSATLSFAIAQEDLGTWHACWRR